MKSILCTECNNEITKKEDLAVAGKLMQPYHKSCLDNPGTGVGKINKFGGKFPLGIKFWFLIFIGNLFLAFMLNNSPESSGAIIFFGIICNIVFLGARIGIYYSYEQYLE